MKNKNNTKRTVILFTALFCFIYIIFALRPLGAELHLTPEWTVDMSRLSQSKEGDEAIPFRLGQNMGYFTSDGRVISLVSFPFKASISENYYAPYGADNRETKFFLSNGEEKGTITSPGFPYFDHDRIFLFMPGGNSFAELNENGEKIWQYESYAPVTAFASSKMGSVAGFADGNLISFTKDGSIDQSFAPGGSDVQVILGADISEDGSMIACLSGQNKQRFVVAQKKEGHSRVVFHEYLEKDFTRQSLVYFNKKGDTVYYNYKGGLGIVDIKKSVSSHVPIEGTITQIEESSVGDIVFVLSRDKDTYTITAIEPFDPPAASFSFKGHNAFIQIRDDALFIGRDNKISRLTISRK